MTNLRTLYWQLPNGNIGKGSPLPAELAIIWLNHLNAGFTNIKYWII